MYKDSGTCLRKLPNIVQTQKCVQYLNVSELDAQRQWYLFEEVATYCSIPEVCPRPEEKMFPLQKKWATVCQKKILPEKYSQN